MPSRRRNAFTLVELLVVLGIIVVLVSILLPVLNSIREQGKSVTCASNVRQLLGAMNSYVTENDGALPLAPQADTYPPPANDPVASSLAYYMASPTVPLINYRDGRLWKYVSTDSSIPANANISSAPDGGVRQRVFNCPSDTGFNKKGASSVQRNFSYSWNFNIRFAWTNGTTRPGVDHLANVVEPAHKIVLEEEDAPVDGISHLGDPTDDTGHSPASRHLKRANYGFADGHVDALGVADVGYITLSQTGTTSTPSSATKTEKTVRAYFFRLNSNSTN